MITQGHIAKASGSPTHPTYMQGFFGQLSEVAERPLWCEQGVQARSSS